MSVFPTACNASGCPETTTEGYCDDHRKAATRKRWEKAERKDGRSFREKGYDGRWDRLSVSYRKRHPLCEPCKRRGETKPAALVHHIWPVEQGGPMYDEDNLEARCKPCHARAHRRGAKRYPDVTLVCGPPGVGKTTYAEQNKSWGDLIVDVDYLWRALTGLDLHMHPDTLLPLVLSTRDHLLGQLKRPQWFDAAWVVATAPKAGKRKRMAADLRTEPTLLMASPEVCKARITSADRPTDPEMQKQLVDRWFEDYEPWEGDTVVETEERVEAGAEAVPA